MAFGKATQAQERAWRDKSLASRQAHRDAWLREVGPVIEHWLTMRYSWREIATYLEEEGWRTSRGSTRWNPTTLNRLITAYHALLNSETSDDEERGQGLVDESDANSTH